MHRISPTRGRIPYDPLKNRIRKLVKNEISLQENENQFLNLFRKEGRKCSCEIIVKLFFLITAIILCLCQSVERIQYYLSEPTVFEISEIQEIILRFMYCHPLSDELFQLREKFDKKADHFLISTIADLLDEKELSLEEIWNASDGSSNIHNVTVHRANIKQNIPISSSNETTLWGICKKYSIKVTKELKPGKETENIFEIHSSFQKHRAEGYVIPAMAYVESEEPTAYRTVLLSFGQRAELYIKSLIKYSFLSLSRKPCVDDEEFNKCQKNCVSTLFLRFANCRAPFIQPSQKLRECRPGEDINSTLYNEFIIKYFQLNYETECKCERPCTVFASSVIESLPALDDPTKHVIRQILSNDIDILLAKEKHSYDLISLLCDIGGNLGLYLGWCLLSIFFGFQVIIENNECNQEKNKFSKHDPILWKVKKVLHQMNRKQTEPILSADFWLLKLKMKILSLGKPKCFAITLSFFAFVYGTYANIIYYLSYPVNVNIEIEKPSHIQFPDLIFCGDTVQIDTAKKRFAKKKKQNYCDIEFLDLLEKYSYSKLWDKSDFTKSWINVAELFKHPLLNVVKINITKVSTPFGICAKFQSFKTEFRGPQTRIIHVFQRNNGCDNYSSKMFIQKNGFPDIDLLSYDMLPSGGVYLVHFTIKEVHKLSTPNKKCVTDEEAFLCRKKCLLKKETDLIPCRLLYMVNDSRTECRSIVEAKEATSSYIKMKSEFEYRKDCNCYPPCNTTVYLKTMVRTQDIDYDGLIFDFARDIIEHYEEVRSFTIIALLCTIGNYLGLLLGLCLYSIFEDFTSLVANTQP